MIKAILTLTLPMTLKDAEELTAEELLDLATDVEIEYVTTGDTD